MTAHAWPAHETDDPSVSLPSRPKLAVQMVAAEVSGSYAIRPPRNRWLRRQLVAALPLLAISFAIGFATATVTLWLNPGGTPGGTPISRR